VCKCARNGRDDGRLAKPPHQYQPNCWATSGADSNRLASSRLGYRLRLRLTACLDGAWEVPLGERFSGKVFPRLSPLKAPPAPFPRDVACVAIETPNHQPQEPSSLYCISSLHSLLTARLGSHASLRRSTITACSRRGRGTRRSRMCGALIALWIATPPCLEFQGPASGVLLCR
jgi:hypothetical protein